MDNRNVGSPLVGFQYIRQSDAVQPGHHHIQQDELYRALTGQLQCLQAIVGPQHPVSLLLQQQGNGLDNLPVVIHYQYTRFHLDISSTV